MFTKKDIETALSNANVLFPICIPSYKRWDRKENKTLTNVIEKCDIEIQKNTYVFVRQEQYNDYKNNFPTVNIVMLPNVSGLADTRQYICDYVTTTLKQKYFIDMDDDITALRYVLLDEEKGKGRLSYKDETDYNKILRLGCSIALYAFNNFNCALGSFRRQRFANDIKNTQNALIINKGSTPRQMMFINLDVINERKIKRNTMFNPTGDDMGFVAELSKNKCDFFNICCLAYDFVDDEVNSVIRNDSNRRSLAKYEFQCLLQYPIGRNYLRIPHKYNDGSYKFSDIDFTKYRKFHNKKDLEIKLEVLYGK